MHGQQLFNEAKKIWGGILLGAEIDLQDIHEAMQSRLVHFLYFGKFYYYLFDVTQARFRYISPAISEVLGFEAAEMDLERYFSLVHPDDQPLLLAFENTVVEFFQSLPPDKIAKYKFIYDLRVRHKSGHFIRILQQVMTVRYKADGSELLTLGIHTDISHVKPDGKSTLSFIGFEGEPSYLNVDITDKNLVKNDFFTAREKDVIRLLMTGESSDAIAKSLHISRYTVDTHRKNILSKSGCRNATELAMKVVSQGLL